MAIIFEDGFENDTLGNQPSNWTITDNQGSATVVDTSSFEGSNSLEVESTTGNTLLEPDGISYGTGLADPVNLAVRGRSGTYRTNLRLWDGTDGSNVADTSENILIVGVNDGNLEYFDGSWNVVESGIGDSWVDITVKNIDVANDTYTLEYNVEGGASGTVDNIAMRNPVSGDGYENIELFVNNEDGSTTETGNYDAVQVGEAATNVDTDAATNIDTDSAQLNGEVTDLGGESSVDAYFEYRETGAGTWNTTGVQSISSAQTYSDTVSGLNSNTEYEFRAVVDDTGGSRLNEGSTLTFTTDQITTNVDTNAATNIRANSADLNGDVTDLGGETSVEAYFRYRETGAGTWNTTSMQTISSPQTYSQNVTGLTSETEYEFEAVVEDSGGTELNSGNTLTFTTTATLELVSPADNFETAKRTNTLEYIVDKDVSGTAELVVDGQTVETHSTPTNSTFTTDVTVDRDNTGKDWLVEFYADGSSTPDDTSGTRTFTVRALPVDVSKDVLIADTAASYSDGIVDSEIYRKTLDSGESLNIEEIEVAERTGGTEDSNFTVQIWDATNSQKIASCNLNQKVNPSVESQEGITVLIRLTNQVGQEVDASFTIRGGI